MSQHVIRENSTEPTGAVVIVTRRLTVTTTALPTVAITESRRARAERSLRRAHRSVAVQVTALIRLRPLINDHS